MECPDAGSGTCSPPHRTVHVFLIAGNWTDIDAANASGAAIVSYVDCYFGAAGEPGDEHDFTAGNDSAQNETG